MEDHAISLYRAHLFRECGIVRLCGSGLPPVQKRKPTFGLARPRKAKGRDIGKAERDTIKLLGRAFLQLQFDFADLRPVAIGFHRPGIEGEFDGVALFGVQVDRLAIDIAFDTSPQFLAVDQLTEFFANWRRQKFEIGLVNRAGRYGLILRLVLEEAFILSFVVRLEGLDAFVAAIAQAQRKPLCAEAHVVCVVIDGAHIPALCIYALPMQIRRLANAFHRFRRACEFKFDFPVVHGRFGRGCHQSVVQGSLVY